MRRLGQHFLKNSAVKKKIVSLAAPEADETIIEIGAGHGELTLPLARACEEAGAKLVAIEKDRELGSRLEVFPPEADLPLAEGFRGKPGTEIIVGDALKLLPSITYNLTPHPYKLVGNIPYYLTGHLFRIVSELAPKPIRCVFTVQKEVAERIAAAPPRMNRLAASVQFWSAPRIAGIVPRSDFAPPPKVDSAILVLEAANPPPHTPQDDYFRMVRALFRQPRKTILNNLRDAPQPAFRFKLLGSGEKEKSRTQSSSRIGELLAHAHLAPSLRPGNLSVADIARIARLFSGVMG